MIRPVASCLALFMLAPIAVLADDSVPPGHSTVHVVFITSHDQQGMGMAAMGGAQTPMARVGDAIVPVAEIRPIRITIDGDFVGHAMVGMWDVKPVFILPEGKHKLQFAIDGFDPVNTELKVLGTNSKQYLIVKLPSKKAEAKNPADSADASTIQPFDN